ncbi:hypothetical protein [Microscilla marina]|uniref:Lipoprotein n=2 Tax=Microscilla TaxID=1023 RepID=A1ZL01_MICM2|nr:hypothetical protein [Microscilla marina]EAY28967.1 hypothetical protein M23134_00121 [Microscilla marina ATCC 23134]
MNFQRVIKYSLMMLFCFSLSLTVESCTTKSRHKRYRSAKRKTRKRHKKIPRKGRIPCPIKDC